MGTINPTLVRADFPIAPSTDNGLLRWSSDVVRELENFRLRLDLIFRNTAGAIPGSGGEDGGIGVPPPFSTNADTVDGYHASQLIGLSRAYSMYPFSDHMSGPVFAGNPNGGFFRLLVEDGVLGIEEEDFGRGGDVRVNVSYRPVLKGRYSSWYHRFLCDDSGPPAVGLQAVTSISLAHDFWFEQNFGFILRDRANGQGWLVYIDDTNPTVGVIGLEKYGFLPWE